MDRCQQGYALANRVRTDKGQVASVGKFLTNIDPSRAPRRFRQAAAELEQMKTGLVDSQRWLDDHDKHCPVCGGQSNGVDEEVSASMDG